jgi:hypothetical protein
MKTISFLALTVALASPSMADTERQLDAHEHGVGQLNIAFEDNNIAMELTAPGADIVGFEYQAKSAEDKTAIDAAIAVLARPLDLFGLPADAGCTVVQASAELESEAEHDHDHSHDHDHDEDHADAAEEDGAHTEFHAEYLLTCADPTAASQIEFSYFSVFPNAMELEVQVVTEANATAFKVERSAPMLDLRGMF